MNKPGIQVLADENIPSGLVTVLRQQAIQAIYVSELDPGLSDLAVLDLALERNCCLLTEDHDFGELIFRRHLPCAGVVLLRLPPVYQDHWPRIAEILKKRRNTLNGRFTVIDAKRIRARQLPSRP